MLDVYGLDGREIPPDRKPLTVRPGVEVRRWPTHYLTPTHALWVDLWRQERAGRRLRVDGALHWPAYLANVLTLLDGEQAAKEAHDGVRRGDRD